MLNILIPLFYIFLYLPIITMVLFSFNGGNNQFSFNNLSLKWYHELFNNEEIYKAFTNSCVISISATIISIIMGIGLIYYIFVNRKNRFTKNYIYIFYINSVLPEVILAVGLLAFFAYFSIPLNMISLTIAHTMLALGYCIPLLYSKFISLDSRVIEASFDLGATSNQTFFKIIIPLLMPAIISSSLLIFIVSFDDFLLSFFCSGPDCQTLSLYIYNAIKVGISPIINALSTILLVISSILVFIFCSLNIKSKLF